MPPSSTQPGRSPLVTCLAGGGAFGFGFHVGIADGMREAGIDISRWPMLGTSAGSHAAAALDNDLSFEDVAAVWERIVDDLGRLLFADPLRLADALYRDLDATDVAAVAVRLLTLRRHVLRVEDLALVDIVAASSAVPPIVRPHRIDGRRWVDGGVRSLASADLAPDADLLVLLTPFATRGQGITGRIGAWQARREIRRWTRRTGGDVLHVVPSPEMAAISSSRLSDVGDIRFGRAVYPLAVDLGRHVGELIASERPALVTAPTTTTAPTTGAA